MSFIDDLISGRSRQQAQQQQRERLAGPQAQQQRGRAIGVPYANLKYPGMPADWRPPMLMPGQQSTGGQQTGGQQITSGGAAPDPDAARMAELRTGLQGTISQLQNAYNSMFGDVRKAATSQRRALDSRYNREVGGLTDQFNQEMPKIGRSYAGRGAYDSSYRMDSEAAAEKGFQNQLTDLSEQRSGDAEKIGQFVSENRAKIDAERGLLNTMGGRLGDINDVNELTQLRNQIDRQLADVQSQRGGLMSREQLIRQAQQLAPANDRMDSLSATLGSIIQGEAPAPLKRAVAQQIIAGAGLGEEDRRRLTEQVNSQIG
jgi:hypothetical protein